MRKLTLHPDALEVDSLPIDGEEIEAIRPTTRPMNTNEPGCTTPDLCGMTP